MRHNMPRAQNHQAPSLTARNANPGYSQQGNPSPYNHTNSPQGFPQQPTHANTATGNHVPRYYPQTPTLNQQDHPASQAQGYYPQAPITNQPAEVITPLQEAYGQNNHQQQSQGKRNRRGWRANSNSNESGPSSNRGLERMMATAEFLQRASAYMDRRGRSRSNRSNRHRK
jgi:hypothetical protein